MGASTDQISQELSGRRAAAERKASVLRARAGQVARNARTVLPALAALAAGSVSGVGVALFVSRRRRARHPVAEQLAELARWTRTAGQRMRWPVIRVEVGPRQWPTSERKDRRPRELLFQIAKAGGSAVASAAGAALTSRLLGRGHRDSK